MALKLLCLSRYDAAGPSSRYRMFQFFPYLRAAGCTIEEAPLLDRRYVSALYAGHGRSTSRLAAAAARRIRVLLRSPKYDVLWLEKELFPYLPAVGERCLRLRGTRIVVDYDDAVFHQYDQHPAALVRAVLGRKIDTVMASAAVVIAGNEYLARRARAAGAPFVEVLPTVVDLERYPLQEAKTGGHLTVGWIGSPRTQEYLRAIAPALATFCAARGARVRAIGAASDFTLPGVPLDVVPWSEATEVASLMEVDIGVMPLPDAPFEHGKCGLKIIQYMACALPVVASPVGVNRTLVTPGETGFLPESQEEWLEALQGLAESELVRRRMGRAGRRRADDQYSLAVAAPRLLALLRLGAGLEPSSGSAC